MLKKLRLRLALLCILMTGAVFAALMLLVSCLSEAQYRQMSEQLFRNNVAAIVSRLQASNTVTIDWLAETEAAQASVIAVESNAVPLRFRGAWQPDTDRETLMENARAYAKDTAGIDYRAEKFDVESPNQIEFELDGDNGDKYRCSVVNIPAGDNQLSLTVVADRAAELSRISGQRILYFVLSVIVLAVLCALSWWFAGKTIKPTAESIERQREFVASASHELRSPLTVISATASAIRVAPLETDELTRGIEAECGRLGRLVDELLLLANTDTASWRLHLAPVELDAILIEAVENYEEPAKKTGFSLALELPDRVLPHVNGDAERLGQVASILLDNAISHAGTGGAITVRAGQSRQNIFISVIDHGKGIPPADRQRVFDRFYQADSSRTDKNHFGLGLSVVKELVRLHKGSIELSETPGGGCTFKVTLPVAVKNRDNQS